MTDEYLQDLYMVATDRGMSLNHAASCAGEIMCRVDSGRSFDCDEYRALTAYAYHNAGGGELEILPSGHKLGLERGGGPCCYPAAEFYVQLPSGMRHWFTTEDAARSSQYWPQVVKLRCRACDLIMAKTTERNTYRCSSCDSRSTLCG